MKVLILGGSGMLGHKLWQVLSNRFETYVTLRQRFGYYGKYGLFDPARTIIEVSADDFDSVVRAVDRVGPDTVVNCIGIVKQSQLAQDPLTSIFINALFPHRLAKVCRERGIRLIHISTDCVFSGRKGNYKESDVSDAEDLYGRTKLLGEVDYEGCLTLRTSMVGREIETSNGLVEWFLSQKGKTVNGYKRAIFSGFTTYALSEIISKVIIEQPDLRGVWHVAAQPISKFDFLMLVNEVYRLKIQIKPEETVVTDRSLDATHFREATGFIPPDWRDMIEQMHRDPTPYSQIRRQHVNG